MSAVEKAVPAAAIGVTVDEATRNLTATAKPALALGQAWRTRNGEVAVIDGRETHSASYPWRGFIRGQTYNSDVGESWTEDGNSFLGAGESDYDLVELISEGARTVSDYAAANGRVVTKDDLEGLGDPDPDPAYAELRKVAEDLGRSEIAARLLASLIVSEYSLEGVSANFQPRLVDLAVEYTDALRARLAVKS